MGYPRLQVRTQPDGLSDRIEGGGVVGELEIRRLLGLA